MFTETQAAIRAARIEGEKQAHRCYCDPENNRKYNPFDPVEQVQLYRAFEAGFAQYEPPEPDEHTADLDDDEDHYDAFIRRLHENEGAPQPREDLTDREMDEGLRRLGY